MKPDAETLRFLYHDQGLSTLRIAAKYGTYKKAVLDWMRKYGIERRPVGRGLSNRGAVPPSRDELFDMVHVQHLGYRAIASKYGVDFTAIPHWLEKHGIERPEAWNTRKKQVCTKPTADELRLLYAGGKSLRQIGTLYGLSSREIGRLCDVYGIIKRRDGWDGGKRFTCTDGHLVRSTYELRVDDWLSAHQIPHSYEPVLPPDPRCHADFLANGWFIEVWGVTHSARYEVRRNRKLELYRSHSLPLIQLPLHSFHTNNKSLWERQLFACLNPAPSRESP